MKKLWQKDWRLHNTIEFFETRDDLLLDQQLVIFDIYGSLSHAMVLKKANIISDKELRIIQKGLNAILELYKKGNFSLEFGDEDIHTKIENYLTEHFGIVGKKIHTGRSRNDQVLTAIRLFTKDKLLEIWKETVLLGDRFVSFAKKHESILMPGYTHMQKAMPSSVGMWAGAFAESLLDDLFGLQYAFSLTDQSPLGSAAGFGTPLAIDREYAASLLGFGKVQNNSLYCQNSRGKVEAAVVGSLLQILLTINKFATDILLFTTSEFGFFVLPDELLSGSSIMPQKKNVDVAELLRSKVHLLLGNYTQLVGISSNLISGYNRDLQDSKKPLLESLQLTLESLVVSNTVLSKLAVDKANLKKAMTNELYATHKAFALAQKNITFRDAYAAVAKQPDFDTSSVSQKTTHSGSLDNLGLSDTESYLKKEKKKWEAEHTLFTKRLDALLKGGGNI